MNYLCPIRLQVVAIVPKLQPLLGCTVARTLRMLVSLTQRMDVVLETLFQTAL